MEAKNVYENYSIESIEELIKNRQIIEYINIRLNMIDRNLYNDYKFHGIKHSMNVGIHSLVILSLLDIYIDNVDVLVDSSLLHDIGKSDDYDDAEHGKIGAILAKKIKKKDPNYNEEKLDLLCALIEGHCNDVYDDSIPNKYFIKNKKNYRELLKILKDADILERTRLSKNPIFDMNKINNEETKKLIKFAISLNTGDDKYAKYR